MKLKRRVIQYVMLLCSLVLLLSVIVPHHHHSNGMPCYKALTETHHTNGSHGCGCDGHNLAYFSSVQFHHVLEGDASLHLFPLLVLFDYINPPEPNSCEYLFGGENAVYIESLHDTWITSASGLRAPPML